MKRLLLLRHAEAEEEGLGGSDRERPLSSRGRRTAGDVAEHLAQAGLVPGVALCSSARRAIETLEPIGQRNPSIAACIEDDLYLASHIEIVARLRALDAQAASPGPECVLVVGHNPGISQLAAWLDPDTSKRTGLSTAALAVLVLRIDRWNDLSSGAAELDSVRIAN